MTMLWTVAVVALVVAGAAWVLARRNARQVAELTAMYWQLKFDHGELKARLAPPSEAPAPQPKETFVPLSQVKRS
jgi:hypothetical protein